MAIGELVKRKRIALGLTQAELAIKAGLRQTYISQVEKGEIALPRDHNLDALGLALEISRGEFYRESGMLDDLAAAPDDAERGEILAIMLAHPQAGPMLIRMKAEAPAEEVRAGPQQEAWAALDAARERARHMYRLGALTPQQFEREWTGLDARAAQLARRSAGPIGVLVEMLPALARFGELPPPDQNAWLRRFALRVVVKGRDARVEWRAEVAEIMA